MLTAMAWVFALMAMGQDAPPGTFVTAEEHGATLKQSVANNTVDTLVKSADVPGGKASVAVLYRTKPEANALIHERVTEVYQILEGSGTLVTGGHLEGATATDLTRLGAGPSRSGKRVGGESHRVKAEGHHHRSGRNAPQLQSARRADQLSRVSLRPDVDGKVDALFSPVARRPARPAARSSTAAAKSRPVLRHPPIKRRMPLPGKACGDAIVP